MKTGTAREKERKRKRSVVFAPGVAALAAAEEPDFTLVCGTELPEPPEREIMFTFGAFDRDGGKRAHRPLFLDDHDLPLAPFLPDLHLVVLADIANIPAFPAF